MQREVSLCGEGELGVFQGGGSGQQGQILLWTCDLAKMRTEMCPLDDISRRHLVISGRQVWWRRSWRAIYSWLKGEWERRRWREQV